MHFDQDGTYNLVYIAEDECGNKTLAERVVEVFSLRTVLYPDGTFIINEKSTDQASNEALHGGTATNVYQPFDPNGATDIDKYIFGVASDRPWHSEVGNILAVEIGSSISPTKTSRWFAYFSNCLTIDLRNLDMSQVTFAAEMFRGCSKITSLDTMHLNTSSALLNAPYMFSDPGVESLDLTPMDVSGAKELGNICSQCPSLREIDISTWYVPNLVNCALAFYSCPSLVTIYGTNGFSAQSINGYNAFYGSENLVGGAGTTYNRRRVDNTYARIDNPPDAPGYFTAKA